MILKRIAAAALAVAFINTYASAQTAAPEPTQSQLDSLAEAIASYVAPSVSRLIADLSTLDANVDIDKFIGAFNNIVRGGDPAFSPSEADAFLDAFVRSRRPSIPDTLSLSSQQEFISLAAKEPGAVSLPSGLVFITERAGTGAHPTDTTDVTVTYTGRFHNGFVFDSTDVPVEMAVGDLVAGFSEGLKLMQPGGRYRIVMPATLAYGPTGIPGHIPGNAALDFTVDLIAISPETTEN